MTRLFFHHVGQQGADRDFPKTVFTSLPIELVGRTVPEDNPHRPHLLHELRTRFPSGRFNCWGMPSGAHSVIRQLSPGDVVFLVRAATTQGNIPAIARVRVFLPEELPGLSQVLWGENRFPFVFFFETEEIDLPWRDFLGHMGYKPELRPRGTFCAVDPARLERWQGAGEYVEYVKRVYEPSFARSRPTEVPASPDEIVELGLERTMCYGPCPVYRVVLARDGTARYDGDVYAPRRGIFHGEIDRKRFDDLARLVLANGFFAFRPLYVAPATDLPSAIVRVGLGNGTVEVRDEGSSDAPHGLRAIEDAIDRVAERIVWRPEA